MFKNKNLFPVGFKGIFLIKSIRSTVLKDILFYIAILLSFVMAVILFFMPDKQLFYIDIVNDMVISIMPALLGLSIAGFAIVANQSNEDFLIKMADIPEEKSDYSFYQKQNAIFSITVLLQLIPLIITVFIKFIKPITIDIPATPLMASIGNTAILFITTLFFVYGLLSILGLIRSIFNTGQIINLLIYKYKLKKIPTNQSTSSTTS